MIPLVVAPESLGTFAVGDCVELIQICGNCTYNNISSLMYPNSTNAVTEATMTQQGTRYNYTFCLTSIQGDYIVNGYGDLDGERTVWSYDFSITPSGTTLTTAQGIVYAIFFVVGLVLFFLFLYSAVRIEWKHPRSAEGKIVSVNDLKYLKIAFWILSYLILMFIMGIASSLTSNYLYFTGVAGFFRMIYVFMLTLMFPITAIAFFLAIVVALDNYVLKKNLTRGLNPR